MAFLRGMKVSWCSHSSPSFLGLLACVQTIHPAKKIGERERFFLRGAGSAAAVHRLQPTGNGFPLLSVTENNVFCRKQGPIKNLSNFNLFTGNLRYACNCTSHPINLWETSEFSCYKNKRIPRSWVSHLVITGVTKSSSSTSLIT